MRYGRNRTAWRGGWGGVGEEHRLVAPKERSLEMPQRKSLFRQPIVLVSCGYSSRKKPNGHPGDNMFMFISIFPILLSGGIARAALSGIPSMRRTRAAQTP